MSTRGTTWLIILVITLFFTPPTLAFAGWFFFDGVFTYPRMQEQYEAFERLNRDPLAWKPYSAARGWPINQPVESKSDLDITVQLICGSICAVMGFGLLGTGMLSAWRMRRA